MRNKYMRSGPTMVTKNSKHDDFILKHYGKNGWTIKKIAAHLNIPAGSVITRHRIARGELRIWDSTKDNYEPIVRPGPSMPKLKFLGEK